MIQVAEFLCLCCRLSVSLSKSRFFVIYYRCVTLADEKAFPWGKVPPQGRMRANIFLPNESTQSLPSSVKNQNFCQLPPGEAFIAICQFSWYNIPNESEAFVCTRFYSSAMATSCRISKSACTSKEITILTLHLPTKTER